MPRFTLPKFTAPVGLTANVIRAGAFAVDEQALSMPPVSTAVIATKLVVPAESPVSLNETA